MSTGLLGVREMDGREMGKRVRVLVAKVGLDGHEVGAKVVARALADAGMEVIYTGLRQTPEMVVEAAIQEDVDVIGISILSGAHMTFFPEILRLLKEKCAEKIVVIGGGVIPVEDIVTLKEMGVRELYPAGSSLKEIVEFVQTVGSENRH
jgi:methylmalonyl-CoA mutase C-terminal domain/subunit